MKFNQPFFPMDSHMQGGLKFVNLAVPRFWDMGIIHFNNIVWHFHDCFRSTGTRARGSTDSFLHSPAIAQCRSAHSSFVLPSVTFAAFVLYGMRHSFYQSMYAMVPKNVCTLTEINYNVFYAFSGYLIFLLPKFHNFLEPNWCVTLKMDSDVHDSFTRPI
jgi:hypothetical protein